MSDRDAYVEKMKARLDQWSADLDRLEARAKEAEADMRQRYDKQVKELRAQRDEVEARLRELQQAGEASWKRLRDTMESAWDEMTRGFRDAADRFK